MIIQHNKVNLTILPTSFKKFAPLSPRKPKESMIKTSEDGCNPNYSDWLGARTASDHRERGGGFEMDLTISATAMS